MLWKMLCICEHHPCFSVGHPWYTTHILRCHPQPWDNLHFRSHLCPQWEMEKYICWILLIAPHNRKWLTGGDQLSTQKFGFLCYRGHWPYRNLDFYATEVIDPTEIWISMLQRSLTPTEIWISMLVTLARRYIRAVDGHNLSVALQLSRG